MCKICDTIILGGIMKTKENLAKELGISRKTLYNYMNILHIKEINDDTIMQLKDFAKSKNKTKEITKDELFNKVKELEIRNAELEKEKENLLQGQTALLNQVEWYKDEITKEIASIKNNMQLLLAPPPKKKNIFEKIFKL